MVPRQINFTVDYQNQVNRIDLNDLSDDIKESLIETIRKSMQFGKRVMFQDLEKTNSEMVEYIKFTPAFRITCNDESCPDYLSTCVYMPDHYMGENDGYFKYITYHDQYGYFQKKPFNDCFIEWNVFRGESPCRHMLLKVGYNVDHDEYERLISGIIPMPDKLSAEFGWLIASRENYMNYEFVLDPERFKDYECQITLEDLSSYFK